jgi:hypothetical protein
MPNVPVFVPPRPSVTLTTRLQLLPAAGSAVSVKLGFCAAGLSKVPVQVVVHA